MQHKIKQIKTNYFCLFQTYILQSSTFRKLFLKDNENININNYTSYNFISNSRDRASGGTSILIKKKLYPPDQNQPEYSTTDNDHKSLTT